MVYNVQRYKSRAWFCTEPRIDRVRRRAGSVREIGSEMDGRGNLDGAEGSVPPAGGGADAGLRTKDVPVAGGPWWLMVICLPVAAAARESARKCE